MAFRALFLFLLLLHLKAGAQSVEWGNPQKIKQKNQFSQIVGECPDGIFVLRCRNADFSSDVIIEKYKTNLSLEMSLPAPISINGNIERVLLVNNVLHIFISARNVQTGNIDVLDQKLDAFCKPVGLPNVICSFPANSYVEKRRMQIKTSADKKNVLMMFLTRNGSGETRLNLYGFNNQIQQQFGKQFTLNETPDNIFITNFESDNNGNAFVLIDFPSRENRNKADNRDFYLYSYYPLEDKMLAHPLGNDSTYIEELGISLNNFNKTVTVTGFYADNEKSPVNAYFMERFNIDKKTTELKLATHMDENMIQQITGTHSDKRVIDLRNYFIRKLIPRSDGGMLIVAEKFQRIEQRFNYYLNNIPQEGVRVTYNYDDVIILSLNRDGTMQFGNQIRKRQSSVGDGGYLSGISVLPTQDNVYVFYNSELDKDGNIMMHFVNYQGKSDERIAVKSSNFSVSLIPSETRQSGPTSMLAATIREKQFTLMRITF